MFTIDGGLELVNLSSEARLGWIMPAFMQDLPLEAVDEDDLVDKVCDLSRAVLENRTSDDQAEFAVILFQIVAQLVETANAVYAGMAFLDIDGRPSMATVLVSRVAHEAQDELTACEAVEGTLKRAFPDDDIRTVQLPRVWAVTRIAAAPIPLPAELSPDGATHTVPRNIIQAYVPVPHGTDFLLFEMSTTSLDDWDLYSELFAEILRTIDWTTDEEVAEYRRMTAISAVPQKPSVSDDMAAALHWQSSRIMDTLQVHRPALDDGDRLSATVCEECWNKGLRSACVAKHTWHIGRLPSRDIETALQRAADLITGHVDASHASAGQAREVSWSVHDEAGGAFDVQVSASVAESQIAVTVTSACSRSNGARSLSDFG